MHNHTGELNLVGFFMEKDSLYDPVETVRLASRAIMRDDNPHHLVIAARHPFSLSHCCRIVAVNTDKNFKIMVFQRRHCMFDHLCDHFMFMPSWGHNGEWSLQLG